MEVAESKLKKVLYNEVSLVIGIIAVAFSVYLFFSNPQRQSEKDTASIVAEISKHEELQSKFEADVKSEINAIRTGDFKDIQRQLSDQAESINQLRIVTAQLQTIINERIPAKK